MAMAHTGGKLKWSDLSPAQRTTIAVLSAVELVVTCFAARDLHHRPPGEVRGPKFLWWPALFVQPIGSPLYLLYGRKLPAPADP